jgi:hypothetical protein
MWKMAAVNRAACLLVADTAAKVFLRHGTQILRAVGATID